MTWRLLAFALGWSAVTVGVLGGLPQFEPVGPELLWTPGWTLDEGVNVSSGGSIDALAEVPSVEALVVSAEVRGVRVTGEAARAQVRHPVVGADGALSWTFPHSLLDWEVSGSSEWSRVQHGFLRDPEATQICLRAELFAASGALELRRVSLREGRWSTTWLGAAALIGAGWLAVAAAALSEAARSADRRWALVLALALTLAYLPVLLVPEGPVVSALRHASQAIASNGDEVGAASHSGPSDARLVARWLWDSYGADDVHVVMFVLLGWAVGYVRRAPGSAAPAALVALSVAGEAIQQFSIDRILTYGDVWQNLLGALVGLLAARAAQVRRG